MFKTRPYLLAGLAALVFSSQALLAQGTSPYSGYNYGSTGSNPYSTNNYGGNNRYRAPSSYGGTYGSPYSYGSNYPSPYSYDGNYRSPYSYSRPYNNSSSYGSSPGYGYGSPYSGTSGYRSPPSGNYRPATPYYRQPYAYGYRPWYRKKKDDGVFGDGPFSGGDFAEEMWPGDDSVWEDVFPVDGPWNRDWGIAPWNRDYADMYGDEGGPDKWFDMGDPKEGAAYMWEDFLYTPHALGTMPGGWDAPTVVVPNPVDVGDEFKDAAGDFPGEMKDFSDGFTYGERTLSGSKPKKDAGSFGMGGKKKKDGINIEPKNRR